MDISPLVTKILFPERRQSVLRRYRLINRLYDMVDHRLIIVSAPAGYGKTTLLVDFVHDLRTLEDHPICWYSLDENDRDPCTFLTHLIHSIEYRFVSVKLANTSQLLKDNVDFSNGAPKVVEKLMEEIVELIPRWFVLVLDDFHQLGEAPEIYQIVNGIVTFKQSEFLTIITSRSTVDLESTIDMLSKTEMGYIKQNALRFHPSEIQDLLAQNYDMQVSDAESRALAEQCEGWITGILLTDPASHKDIRTILARARASGSTIYSYLAKEIYEHQEPEVREFMIVSSTLREVRPSLCRDILGLEQSRHFLELVEQRNLFIVRLEGEGDWYRYHQLIRDYLQTRLQREDRARWAALHRRAADWFEAHEHLEDAVHHHLTVDAHADAARVMEMAVQDIFYAGRLETLMAWGAALPDPARERAPRLALFQSRAAHMLGQWQESLALTEIAERGYRAREDHCGLAYTLLHRCEVWQAQGRFQEALDLGQETLALVKESGVPVAYEARRILGQSCLALGQLDEGETHLRQALEHCAEQGSDFEQASVQTALVECLWRQGRWDEAIAVQKQTVEIRRRLGNPGVLSGALNNLGFFLYSTGEYNQALELFAEALALARRSGHRRNEAMTLLSLGELLRDLGALNQAAAACEAGLALADELGDAFLSAYGREALGLTRRWQDDHAGAQVILGQALDRAERQRSEYQAGRYGASLGLVWVEAGETDAGLATLAQACERLERIGARSELARARFFAAWARFQAGQEARALADLRSVLASGDLPNRNLLFVVEGRRMLPMLEQASKQGMGDTEIAILAARARAFARAAQDVLEKAASLEIKIGSDEQSVTRVTAEPDLRVYGFGKGRAARGGKELHISEWGAAATRWMLFFMLIYRQQSREQIAVVLWPELETRKVKANFHTTQFRLDRAVGQDTLCYEGGLYRVHPEFDYWFDVEEFEKLLREPEKDPARRLNQLRLAAQLYSGDFLEDCYADWAVRRREALREQYAEVMDELARRLLGQRQYREAIKALSEGLQIDDLRERFYSLLMRAYALSGQPEQAVAQYQRCAEILEEELNTTPSRETSALCERIKKGLPLD